MQDSTEERAAENDEREIRALFLKAATSLKDAISSFVDMAWQTFSSPYRVFDFRTSFCVWDAISFVLLTCRGNIFFNVRTWNSFFHKKC